MAFELVEWNGDEIVSRIKDAATQALDETAQACAADAAAGRRSGRAADITAEPASGNSVRWGFFPPPHGTWFPELFIEIGNAYYAGDNAKRRAADANYPRLAGLIRGIWGG